MRKIIGFCMILLLVPSLYRLCTLTLNEIFTLQSLNHVLDSNLKIDQSAMQLNSAITDSNGQVIKEIYQTENRKYIKDADIPQIFKRYLRSFRGSAFLFT